MKKIITSERLPIKLWLDNPEDSALKQIINLANLPFAFKHIAIMPDCHAGYGMPIGGVLATNGVIIPNAVGVDIGCGMCALKTNIEHSELSRDELKIIINEIRKVIPLGFNHHKEMQDKELMPKSSIDLDSTKIVCSEYGSALYQLGTLGGGNHFIEIQKDNEDFIWVMIHSGSRNLGYKVANHYNKIAVKLNEKWHSSVPKKWELAFLPLDSDEGVSYINEMRYCIKFALANRELMIDRIYEILTEIIGSFDIDPLINIAHNYAAFENHYGTNVMVHRKGATLARKDTIGIIPGSQGSKSYIVKGLGNQESFMSCSHGAGRKMGRNEAKKILNLEEEISLLEKQNILHSIRNIDGLDEATGAYKDIQEVMESQKDLVEIITELTPIAVIKA